MAKQRAQYRVGREGNVIFYKLNGDYYLRTVPARVRQTKATKLRSSNFSIAVGAASVLRKLLEPAIPFPKDKKMQNSFGGAIMKWLKQETQKQLKPGVDLPYIQGFQFNEKTELRSRWKVTLAVTKIADNLIQLHIPAFIPADKIQAPAWTHTVECTIAAAACTLQNTITNGNTTNAFSIPYNSTEIPAQTIDLPLSMPPGSLVVVVVSLTCIVSKKNKLVPTDNIAFMPAGIIAAMYVK